jgi:catechol 2,3-dioxygenase
MEAQAAGQLGSQAAIAPATRIGPVTLTVADLDRQSTFYQDVLGLKLLRRDGPMVSLGAGGEDLVRLIEDRAAPRARGTTGLYHFAVLVPDRKELARRLARLYALRYTHYPTDHVMTETTYLSDPEGNGIEIYVDTPERGTWGVYNGTFAARAADGTLRSGRDPLDVEALLALLAPEDRLDGPLPEATKIGHIHLHVADLEHAVRFYHDVLGFDIMTSLPAGGAAFVSAGGYHHHIGLNTWLGEGAPPPPPGSLGLRYFTIVVPDRAEIDRIASRVAEAGLRFDRAEAGITVRDPSQNQLWLTHRPDSAAP